MHRKVLIVGTVPYNRRTTSRAFESYFSNWEKDNLIQIFSDPREPLKGHCGALYQITDKMMLKRRLKRSAEVGVIYNYSELDDEWKNADSAPQKGVISTLYKLGSRKFPLNYLMRGRLWKKKYWQTEKLDKWLDGFKPECVFLAFSDDFFIPSIALYAAERYDVPIVSCIGDDYYFNDRFSVSPFYHIYRNKYKRLIDRVFAHGGSAAYIGDKIRDKYNREFGLDGETVYLTSEIERSEFRPIDKEHPKLLYCGNIRLGRSESLMDIAEVLQEINPSYRLTVYSNEADKKFYRPLQQCPGIDYRGTVPYSEVKRALSDCDVAIAVEGFDKKDVDITRYSLSTKVADSLQSGRFVLGYGSAECGAIDYLLQIGCGLTCTSKAELREKLPRVFDDIEYQRSACEKAGDICCRHHSLERSTAVFEEIVEKAIDSYGKQQAER